MEWNGTVWNGTERLKREEKRNGTERNGTGYKTERKRGFFLTRTVTLLKSREIQSLSSPENVLHVYKKNIDVNEQNTHMLNKLAPRSKQIVIEAEDDTRGQTRQTSISNMPKNVTATGVLPTTLILAEGAKGMLTVNVDVSDGLVNGARGIIGRR